MSSNEGKKSKESPSDLEKQKSRTVYERLKRAYLEPYERSDENLGKMFGDISKQAIGQRKKSGNWDPQEILDLFPDVNYEWIFSEELQDLRTLPVRSDQKEASDETSTSSGKDRLSPDEIKSRLEEIESIARSLKDSF